jgi:hypothetical protein
MSGTVLRDVALWHQLYLATKPSHVGADVNGLAYPCTVLWHAAVGSGTFPGDVKP